MSKFLSHSKTHHLKMHPRFFRDLMLKAKNFEIRKNDREYKIGDTLVFEEWNGVFTGECLVRQIAYILTSNDFPEGLKKGYAILGFK